MIDPRFVLRRITNTNYKGWLKTAQRLGKETGRGTARVLADMLACTIKHGSGYVDYDTLKMYQMNESERANILTIGRNNTLVRTLNDCEKRKIFEQKPVFNRVFKDFVKREWVLLDGANYDDFAQLCKNRDCLIAKPVDQSCGDGIQRIDLKEWKDLRLLYTKLLREAPLVEEVIEQDPQMSKLCTTSINTIRVVTLTRNGNTGVLMAAVRMGREGNFVDNLNFGGYGAKIGGLASILDPETGKIIMPAFDKNRERYDKIPVLGTEVVGFQIPRWSEVIDFVKEAALVVPEVGFVGWDVCISRDRGLLLIEGNDFPGNDLQVPALGIGTYDKVQKILSGDK